MQYHRVNTYLVLNQIKYPEKENVLKIITFSTLIRQKYAQIEHGTKINK